jgi:hypothetical protein
VTEEAAEQAQVDRLRRRALLIGAANVTAYLAVAFGRFRATEPMGLIRRWSSSDPDSEVAHVASMKPARGACFT